MNDAAGDRLVADLVPRASVASFRRDWLQRLGLDPAQCAVLRVEGESMEPTLPAGCSILIDRSWTRRRDGQIFVLRTAEGMVVKRTVRGNDGRWQLGSDHPAWEPVQLYEPKAPIQSSSCTIRRPVPLWSR